MKEKCAKHITHNNVNISRASRANNLQINNVDRSGDLELNAKKKTS